MEGRWVGGWMDEMGRRENCVRSQLFCPGRGRGRGRGGRRSMCQSLGCVRTHLASVFFPEDEEGKFAEKLEAGGRTEGGGRVGEWVGRGAAMGEERDGKAKGGGGVVSMDGTSTLTPFVVVVFKCASLMVCRPPPQVSAYFLFPPFVSLTQPSNNPVVYG